MQQILNKKSNRPNDQIILNLIQANPKISWKEVAETNIASGFDTTPKKCRDRYELFLKVNDLSKYEWTKKDEDLLKEKFKELGPKWNIIATNFIGVTARTVKQHWEKNNRKSFLEDNESDEEVYDEEDEDDQNYDPDQKQQKAIAYMNTYPRRTCIENAYGKDKDGNDIKAVQIKMQGSRKKDIEQYIHNGGLFPQGIVEYHHNTDMDAHNNCTMIALPTSRHNKLKPHYGAACQYRARYGMGY